MKVLFIVPYPNEGASNRLRVEQFLPYLRANGIEYTLRPFIGRGFYRILYLRHKYLKKILFFIFATVARISDIFRAMAHDIIFIHREAYPFGPPVFEHIFRCLGKPIIYDFDDAIFLRNTSGINNYIERFKNPGKISGIVSLSRYVIAGNRYLRDFAARFNINVIIIPTTIDTDMYRPPARRPDKKEVVIGWIGSNTTRRFLRDMEDVFKELSARYDNLVFKIVGGYHHSELKNVVNIEWSMEREIELLGTFDIGIMPMPDDEWTRGKCAFKAILYMACGIVPVCSPVGVNTEVVQDGVNGYLANDKSEWVGKLSALIEDRGLRERMAASARALVEKKYSVKTYEPVFLRTLRAAGSENG
ncbi:MAG: glycosyltransferase family 4 protein [Candidatus Omnitrophota bacterium]|nr:glycosyltransferase family 4 protein [Candidatus Omnitrophota bacterium]